MVKELSIPALFGPIRQCLTTSQCPLGTSPSLLECVRVSEDFSLILASSFGIEKYNVLLKLSQYLILKHFLTLMLHKTDTKYHKNIT